ncbi:hypothetical protein [Gardnerella vaginalis]|uniref:hypothetical protein n=1 Tax=Gardnerella vaginalis TaxID=2702 RepID=UPI0001E8E9F8|nr:hypothetical protein [Gardnerella vaginalis]KOS08933.1 hypothetical protein AM507_02760 [Gardnerella vaginalis]BAQ32872.1 hypothetical protein GAVG_0220 [Gardnerella vaginalis ATCC 14018 = JCM 11026]SDR95594.1 colicin import membrane protein [Gardnerella vaginalis]VEH17043.1 Uncharacterised protein [Gardnerella vaginalis]
MMNKKAIAAFAAGATLLAGFAMATPAFAADGGANTQSQEVKKSKADLKKELDTARANYEAAVAAEKAADEAATKAAAALQTVGAKPADANDGSVKIEEDNGHLKVTTTDAAKVKEKEAAEKYVNAYNADVDAKAAKTAAEQDKNVKATAYLAAEQAYAKAPEPKAAPSDDQKKAEAVEAVKTAKLHLDDAFAAYTKDYAEYEKAKATLAGKVAAQEAAQKALKAAQDALEAYKVSAKNDSALAQRLTDAVARAQAKVDFAVAETAKATKDYDEAKAKAVASTAKYNAALTKYKAAYNDAVRLGVNPAVLPAVVTSDPLAPNFEDVPGAAKAMNDAASGKLGKAAQQEAGKAAAGKAAAKGELAAKGGHGKSGEKLGNAGVGVALTALAASMLAGMGAAVRKMRH